MGSRMKNKILKPLFREDEKKTLRILTIKDKLRKKPAIGYAIFAFALIMLNELAKSNIVESTFVSAISSTLIYCIISIGFCLLLGYSALASLGTAGFFCLGANITYMALVEWDVSILFTFIIVYSQIKQGA